LSPASKECWQLIWNVKNTFLELFPLHLTLSCEYFCEEEMFWCNTFWVAFRYLHQFTMLKATY
jgi:hypothetical protein